MKKKIDVPLVRIFGITAFAAAMIFISVSAFAQAEGDFYVDLTSDGTGVVITGYVGNQRDVKIPATIQGFPVREIGDRAFNSNSSMVYREPITGVTIPDGVVKIGNSAFEEQRLTSVTIPASVTVIEARAFSWCQSLATITFSEGLVEIGEFAFAGCRALRTLKLPDSLTKLGAGAFNSYNRFSDSSSGITSLTLGTGLTEIPDIYDYDSDTGVFSGHSITDLVIPEGITKIGSHAFSYNTKLTSVTLPSTIVEIGGMAFGGCSELTTVNIPETLTSVNWPANAYDNWGNAARAFGDCPKLLLAVRAALQRLGYQF